MSAPLAYEWTGEAFSPLPRFQREADARFVVGEHYTLDAVEMRNMKAHNAFMAFCAEVWRNFPEDQADRWPTPTHLRKWALIQTGFRDERTHVCASKADAQRLAAFIKPMDDYAVIIARESVVVVLTAKSQSIKAMGADTFKASKAAVEELLSSMIGVTPQAAHRNAREVA